MKYKNYIYILTSIGAVSAISDSQAGKVLVSNVDVKSFHLHSPFTGRLKEGAEYDKCRLLGGSDYQGVKFNFPVPAPEGHKGGAESYKGATHEVPDGPYLDIRVDCGGVGAVSCYSTYDPKKPYEPESYIKMTKEATMIISLVEDNNEPRCIIVNQDEFQTEKKSRY